MQNFSKYEEISYKQLEDEANNRNVKTTKEEAIKCLLSDEGFCHHRIIEIASKEWMQQLFITTVRDKENKKIYKLPKDEQYWFPRKGIDKEYDEKGTYTRPIYHIRWILQHLKGILQWKEIK